MPADIWAGQRMRIQPVPEILFDYYRHVSHVIEQPQQPGIERVKQFGAR